MTDNTAKNLIGRDYINLRDALKQARSFVEGHPLPTPARSALLARIDTLIYKHADPEMDIAKMWAAGDYRSYPVMEDL